mgnify:FL=1
MAKWNKDTFLTNLKKTCMPHITNIVMDLVTYTDDEADSISWGRGEGYGTMTFKCKSDDFGIVSLFHVTTAGQIKFLLNNMRNKIRKKEILRDFQLKLESNFMMDFNEDEYDSDIYYDVDSLFNTKSDIDKFKSTINGIAARLKQ